MMSLFHRVGTPFMEFLYSWENKYKDKLMVDWKEDAILLDFFVYIGHDSHILIFCGKICITGRISWKMTRNVQVIFHQKGNHIYMYVYEAYF